MSSFEADTLKRIAPEEWGEWEFLRQRHSLAHPEVWLAADAYVAKLVAAVEERDRMLEVAFKRHDHRWDLPEKLVLNSWLADLRARAARDREPIPETCGDCRYCIDPSDHIAGCDQPHDREESGDERVASSPAAAPTVKEREEAE